MAENKIRKLINNFGRHKNKLLRTIGELVVNDSLQNFKTESFEGQKWKSRKDGSTAGERTKRRNLLVKSGRLRRSIRVVGVSSNSVTVGSDVPYAKVHNEGGVTNPRVTEKSRRFFWAMYKKTGASKWKSMALTKQKSFKVDIPQRQFIGITQQLKLRIRNKIFEMLFRIK